MWVQNILKYGNKRVKPTTKYSKFSYLLQTCFFDKIQNLCINSNKIKIKFKMYNSRILIVKLLPPSGATWQIGVNVVSMLLLLQKFEVPSNTPQLANIQIIFKDFLLIATLNTRYMIYYLE